MAADAKSLYAPLVAGPGVDAPAFETLIRSRNSVRDFDSDREIEQEKLEAIMADISWAPSWCNTHPYFFCIARGERLLQVRGKLCALYDGAAGAGKGVVAMASVWARGCAPDGDFSTLIKYPPHLQKHRVDCAKGLYGLMEVAREDTKKREAQDRRNFEFFGAPCVFFVFVQDGMGPFSPLDAGFALDTLLLSAHARGLGACAQGALATWASPVREAFPEVPRGYKLLCGVSMGYAKAGSKINTYKPARCPVACAGL